MQQSLLSPHNSPWRNLCKFVGMTCCLIMLAACQQAMTASPPLPEGLSIGIIPVKQALTTTDLLAGSLPAIQGKATVENLQAFDAMFRSALRASSKRDYVLMRTPRTSILERDYRSTLEKLLEQADAARVDMIIVPIIVSWTERKGGEAGVVSPAELDMDIFLINVADKTVLKRIHFSEQQEALTTNLLNAPSFFKRGGKWVTTLELAKEATQLSILDFGL